MCLGNGRSVLLSAWVAPDNLCGAASEACPCLLPLPPITHTHTPNHTHLITPRTPRHTNQTGVPIMRPLWYEFPAKEELFGVDDEFMLGPGLLVKPITHVSLTRV